MRLPFLVKLVGVVCLIAIASRQAFSCQCGGIHGKDAWEVAKKQTEGATVIFEGTPDHFEWQWYVLGAKAGELIPANDSSSTRAGKSRMLVTFRVTRAYKGDVGSEVQISTGLGGGDCGAVFATGLTYLVYAYGSTPRELDTSMCDPGGWIGSRNVLANLRYLREQRPLPADLTPGPWWAKWSPEKETQQQHEIEEFKKRYAAVTGRICGTVSGEGSANG